MNEITIKRVENGYVVEYIEEESGDRVQAVFQDQEGVSRPELDPMCQAMWYVIDYFGLYRSKHSQSNLVVYVETNDDPDQAAGRPDAA